MMPAPQFSMGAYTYQIYWNGKEYSGGRRFVSIVGVGNKREYRITLSPTGQILDQGNASREMAEAAVAALGWQAAQDNNS